MHTHKTHVHLKKINLSRNTVEEISASIINSIYDNNKKPLLIAVGGPGGTGKSTFCIKLAALLLHSNILSLDDYKKSRDNRANKNIYGAHPDANNIKLLINHLNKIKNKQSITQPVYNSITGKIDSTKEFIPKAITILDGEISTYPQFREFVDFSIFIDSDWKTQLNTRIYRDIEEKKYSREKAVATFLQSNLREFSEFGAKSKNWADIHIYCKNDYHLVIESVSRQLYENFPKIFTRSLSTIDISGLIVATLTPFTSNNKIDKTKYIEHLQFLASHGVKKILINGTTGEFFSLKQSERKLILKLARSYFPGIIIFHAGCDSLAQTEEEVKWGEEYGADAIAVLPPYYIANAPKQGIIDYFNRLESLIDIPFILYNFPKHTQNQLTKDILKSINHYGIKDSSANLSLIEATPKYFVGSDKTIVSAFQKRCRGFVSARANIFPDIYVNLEIALSKNDFGTAKLFQKKIIEIANLYSGNNQIAMIKYKLNRILPGYNQNVRLPLVHASNREISEIDNMSI